MVGSGQVDDIVADDWETGEVTTFVVSIIHVGDVVTADRRTGDPIT